MNSHPVHLRSQNSFACFSQIEMMFVVIYQITDVLVSQHFKVVFNLNDIIILISLQSMSLLHELMSSLQVTLCDTKSQKNHELLEKRAH